MSRRTAEELLEEALAHLEIAREYAQEDLAHQMVLDAASLRLAAAIETLSRLDEAYRQPPVPATRWRATFRAAERRGGAAGVARRGGAAAADGIRSRASVPAVTLG